MTVVFADSALPPLPPGIASPWLGLTHTLTGSNGDTIGLSDVSQGVVLINADVVGMNAPKYETYRSGSPAAAGSRYRGARTLERPAELSILVMDDNTTEGFLETDRRVWDLIGDPTQPVVWRVQTPDGDWRELTMRFDDASDAFARDPLYDGWVLYQLRFIADDPYWYGPPISREWSTSDVEDFFRTAAPVTDLFFISRALTTDSVVMPNPGDVEAWVTWVVKGALSNLDLTLKADGMTDGSLGIPDVIAGETLVTWTDPRIATAELEGVDITEQIDPWDPRPIPARGEQTLEVAVVIAGTGSLSATIRPRHRRAW